MYILLDIEWAEKWRKSFLTQIAAIRVNENWEEQDSFSHLVSPPQPEKAKWQHVAFSGYDPADFLNADDEATVLAKFRECLQEDDVLCFWHYEARMCLERLWQKHMKGSFPNQGKLAYHRVFYRLMNYQGEEKSLYSYAEDQGLETPNAKHMAVNDVAVMRDLLSHIYVNWDDFAQKVPKMPAVEKTAPKNLPPKKKKTKQPVKNKTLHTPKPTDPYFFFSKDSVVFHKKGCVRISQSKEVQGTSYYDEACTTRRPCKICNPQPQDGPGYDNVTRYVKFFSGTMSWTKNKNIVGYCHFHGHPGKVSKGLLLKHGCIEKRCHYLEKYPQCSFWKQIDAPNGMEQLEEMQRKANHSQWLNEYLIELKEEFQSYMVDTDYPVKIIRIEKKTSRSYKVIYVSDSPVSDVNKIPSWIKQIQASHPLWRFDFQRAEDINGRFYMVKEFSNIKMV